MLFRSLVVVATLLATPALAQDDLTPEGQAVETAIQAYAARTNDQRREVLVSQLRAAGYAPELQAFEGGNGRTGPLAGANVVVTVGTGEQNIVLTGHFDAVPLSDGVMSQGVVDNAGSIALMMEALGLISDQLAQSPSPYRYVFVFTDQEELGLIGARKWLEGHDRSRIHAVINLDVNGYGETLMYGENVGEASTFVLAAMRTQCAERAVDCVAFPNYPPSDDRVFSAAGLPVISIGSQDAIGAHQMWLAFNGGEQTGLAEGFVPPVFHRIHSPGDSMEWIDGDDILKNATFIADLALRLSRTD